MKDTLIVSGAFVAGATVTIALQSLIHLGQPSLALIMGAVVGSQIAAWRLALQPGVALTVPVKASVGLCLAINCVLFAILLQLTLHWLPLPEVSVPISAIGSFVLPFALMASTFRAFRQAKERSTTSGA